MERCPHSHMNSSKIFSESPSGAVDIFGDTRVTLGIPFAFPTSKKKLDWRQRPFGILVWIETGLLRISSLQKSFVASTGEIYFVPPNLSHAEEVLAEASKGIYVCLPKEGIEFLPQDICRIQREDLLLSLMKRIASWGAVDIETQTKAQNRLSEVLLDELREAKITQSWTVQLPRQAALAQVANAILKDPSDMKPIDHWAKVAAMSRRSFTEKFYEETGLTFSQWRQNVKLQASLKCLSEGKTVSQVALNLGYQSPSAFIVMFRKQFGVTPRKKYSSRRLR